MTVDYYTILGVKRNATVDEIREAYRRLAMKWHPDRHQADSRAEKAYAENMFKMINEAYHGLMDGDTGESGDAFSAEDGDFGSGHAWSRLIDGLLSLLPMLWKVLKWGLAIVLGLAFVVLTAKLVWKIVLIAIPIVLAITLFYVLFTYII